MLSPFSPVPFSKNHGPDRALVERATTRTMKRHDPRTGSMGTRPVAPRALPVDFLLLQYARRGDRTVARAVAQTLAALARSGVHDALGGGFHRGAFDAGWREPDFGKTTADNALLAVTYLRAWRVLGRRDFGRVAIGTLAAMEQELALPEGGFRTGAHHGSEDLLQRSLASYRNTWTREELDQVLDPESAQLAALWWGVLPDTWSAGAWGGRHALRVRSSIEALAATAGMEPVAAVRALDRARAALRAHRDDRPTAGSSRAFEATPNGLAVSAFAHAALWLEDGDGAGARWLATAQRTAHALYGRLWNGRRLLHAAPRGEPGRRGSLADYACSLGGMLDLFEASGELRWLDRALELEDAWRAQLDDEPIPAMRIGVPRGDDRRGPRLAAPPPDEVDGGAIMARSLLRLASMTSDPSHRERAEGLLRARAPELLDGAIGKAQLALAFTWSLLEPRVLSVVHDGDARAAAGMVAAALDNAPPWITVLRAERGADLERKRSRVPSLEHRQPVPGVTRAWLCRGRACPPATSDPDELARILDETNRVAS